MMHTFLVRYKILFAMLFLVSCHNFMPVEPVAPINDKFNARYGRLVDSAKKRHYDSVKSANTGEIASFGRTAVGRMKQKEIDFIESNTKNNPYPTVEGPSPDGVRYLSENSIAYAQQEHDFFDDINPSPKNDFKHYDLGKKNYDGVDNKELQEAYDHINLMNIEKERREGEVRIQEQMLSNQKNSNDLIEKAKQGLQSLTNTIKALLGK